MEQPIPPNSIQALSSLLPQELMRILSENPKSVSSSLDILAAYFSQMPVYFLFITFQNSGIIQLAEILREFVKSGNLLERKVQRNRQRKFIPSQSQSQVQNTKRKEGGNQVRPTGITKSKD